MPGVGPKDAVSVRSLESSCERLVRVVHDLEEKLQLQGAELVEHKDAAKNWRMKCLETLDALDVATAALSEYTEGQPGQTSSTALAQRYTCSLQILMLFLFVRYEILWLVWR